MNAEVRCASPRMDPSDPDIDLCNTPARKFTPQMAKCLLQNKFATQIKQFAALGKRMYSPLAHNREIVCVYPRHDVVLWEPGSDDDEEDEVDWLNIFNPITTTTIPTIATDSTQTR